MVEYYQILGVQKNATQEDIKKAWVPLSVFCSGFPLVLSLKLGHSEGCNRLIIPPQSCINLHKEREREQRDCNAESFHSTSCNLDAVKYRPLHSSTTRSHTLNRPVPANCISSGVWLTHFILASEEFPMNLSVYFIVKDRNKPVRN